MNRLFWEETIRVFDPPHPQFHCSCTREKVGNMLKMLGQAEVDDALAELGHLGINCDFCGKHYEFDKVDCAQLFASSAPVRDLAAGQRSQALSMNYARQPPGRFSPLPRHSDPLDGQRRLPARQQRRLLLLVRHGGEPVPDRAVACWTSTPDRLVGMVVDTRLFLLSLDRLSRPVHVGVRVAKLGNSSVRYELALFKNEALAPLRPGTSCTCMWTGTAIRPVPVPEKVRALLASIAAPQ